MPKPRTLWASAVKHVDRRDVLGVAGCALLYIGGERLMPGAGYCATGIVLAAVAVFGVR